MTNTTDPCQGCSHIVYESRLFSIPIITIATMSFLGNLTVILVLLKDRHLKPMRHDSNQLLYMFSMALSDICSSLCHLIFSARYALTLRTPASKIELDIGAASTYLFLTVSLFSIIGIGIDKLFNILTPYGYQRNWTRLRCLISILSLWLCISLLSILPTQLVNIPNYYYKFNPITMTFVTQHEATISAMFVIRIFMFIMLIAILGFGYIRLYMLTRKMKSNMPKMSVMDMTGNQETALGTNKTSTSSTNTHSTGRLISKGTIMIFLILGSFLLFWLPYFFVQIGDALRGVSGAGLSYARRLLNFSLMWFAMLHTSVNVVIYSGIYRPFRKALLRVLHLNRGETSTSTRNTASRIRVNKTDMLKSTNILDIN